VEIDIRKEDLTEVVDVIRFNEDGILQNALDHCVFVTDSEDGDRFAVELNTKKDAEHLIKALEKAISLGWWK
jgi:hypothetical protein